jgi:hypothetical protein
MICSSPWWRLLHGETFANPVCYENFVLISFSSHSLFLSSVAAHHRVSAFRLIPHSRIADARDGTSSELCGIHLHPHLQVLRGAHAPSRVVSGALAVNGLE